MNESIVSLEAIGIQAARAAAAQLRTGRKAQNPYCAVFEPGHHAEFARRLDVAIKRLQAPVDSEASA